MPMNGQAREMIHQDYSGLMGARADLLVAVKEILASAGYTSGEAEPTLRELKVGIVALDRGREAVRKAESPADNLTLNRMVQAAQQVLAPDRIGFDVHVHLTTGLVRDAILAVLDTKDVES